ncbi:hypothetical protein COY28_02270 [Candidatus Woesearchaeota archaeon CG_4_10_14_0_2_um_filter_57_5]|nr:MAG: hypothetical protein AUJ68_01005 [Candidatus Woesearchaeota archaeon CG1_02_57_44]PIN67471.1 MAG: hypothetical protein COV94_07250 [Candidatus Woesearchaeota archaeon CG11_big_fil_rev_8_21_14_0_20_57_5]PIZ54915.1 MAG: hypothetical protein COY28_02270 [Candidatus Woesearchaeota archaeon CG_4_10_14_0_2_um_filter_57_5]
MDKHGDTTALKIVVFAMLLLLIVAVMLVIFSQSSSNFTKSNQCASKGGECFVVKSCSEKQGYSSYALGLGCPNQNEKCCVKEP